MPGVGYGSNRLRHQIGAGQHFTGVVRLADIPKYSVPDSLAR
jgi:hypothetical protein